MKAVRFFLVCGWARVCRRVRVARSATPAVVVMGAFNRQRFQRDVRAARPAELAVLAYLQEWCPDFGLLGVEDTSDLHGMFDVLITGSCGRTMKVDTKVNNFWSKPQITLEFEKRRSGVWVPSYALDEVDGLFTLCSAHRRIFYTALGQDLLFGLQPLRPHFEKATQWTTSLMGDDNAMGLHRDPAELIDLGCCIELTHHLNSFSAENLKTLCFETLALFAKLPDAA